MPPMPEGRRGWHPQRACINSSNPAKEGGGARNCSAAGPSSTRSLRPNKILEKDYGWPRMSGRDQLQRTAPRGPARRTPEHAQPGTKPEIPYVTKCLDGQGDVFIFASDYMKIMPDGIAQWVPGPMLSLGTDGFGRSDSRKALRDFFEVDARHIVFGTLVTLAKEKENFRRCRKASGEKVGNQSEEIKSDDFIIVGAGLVPARSMKATTRVASTGLKSQKYTMLGF